MKQIKVSLMHLMMLKRILTFLNDDDNITITDSLPAFRNAADALNLKVQKLDSLLENYIRNRIGITAQKNQARRNLVRLSCRIMSSVRSYAISNNNNVLAAQMKFTLTQLFRMPCYSLITNINNAISSVTSVLPSLGNYNITAVTIANWQAALDALNNLLSTPQNAIANRKTSGEIFDKEMKAAMQFLRQQMDTLAISFSDTYPQYYLVYRNSRKLIHTGIRHTRLLASVVDELGQPQFGATVKVDELNKDDKTYNSVSSNTNMQGNAEVKEFESGYRTITISGKGIATKTFGPFKFISGRTMQKSFTVRPQFTSLPVSTNQPQETVSKS